MVHDLWLGLKVLIAGSLPRVTIYVFAARTIANFSKSDPSTRPE